MIGNGLIPEWLIIDKAAPATEAEILIAITKHVASIRLELIIGDIKQLRAVIITARLMRKSFVERKIFQAQFACSRRRYRRPVSRDFK